MMQAKLCDFVYFLFSAQVENQNSEHLFSSRKIGMMQGKLCDFFEIRVFLCPVDNRNPEHFSLFFRGKCDVAKNIVFMRNSQSVDGIYGGPFWMPFGPLKSRPDAGNATPM